MEAKKVVEVANALMLAAKTDLETKKKAEVTTKTTYTDSITDADTEQNKATTMQG